MSRLPRKTILVSVALVLLVVISAAFSAPPEKKFKNLKVLPKNINDKELDSVMHIFTRGLGVKCNFCHAENAEKKLDYASDAKPEKNIARKMMKMRTSPTSTSPQRRYKNKAAYGRGSAHIDNVGAFSIIKPCRSSLRYVFEDCSAACALFLTAIPRKARLASSSR